MKKKICFLFLCTSIQILAQEKTSMKTFGKSVTDKFPTTRIFDIQYEQLGATEFNSKLLGEKFEQGRIDDHNRLKIAFNLPFYVSNSKRFILTSSLRYKYESYAFDNRETNTLSGPFPNEKEDFHYFAGAISATYMSKLFNKPIIYNATTTIDGNQENIQRIKGFVSATLVLKKTASTTITIGALVMMDPSSIIPITPLFTYNHKFKNSTWDIDFILPQRLLFRRDLFENGRFSLGTELNSENFYLNLKAKPLTGIYELNQLELKSGITYEHRFSAKVHGLFKVGINNIINTRITERGERTTKYVYEHKENPQAYFRLGISYNPF